MNAKSVDNKLNSILKMMNKEEIEKEKYYKDYDIAWKLLEKFYKNYDKAGRIQEKAFKESIKIE